MRSLLLAFLALLGCATRALPTHAGLLATTRAACADGVAEDCARACIAGAKELCPAAAPPVAGGGSASPPEGPKGCLTRDVVTKVMDGSKPTATRCFDRFLHRVDACPTAAVRMRFVVGPSGDVIAADVLENGLDERMELCLLTLLDDLSFPSCETNGTAEVTYPWHFKCRE